MKSTPHTQGTPEHAAAVLAAVREGVKLAWTATEPAGRWEATGAGPGDPFVILHVPGLGFWLMDEVTEHEGLEWNPDARTYSGTGKQHTRAAGEVFPTIEDAKEAALWWSQYNEATRRGDVEGIPERVMLDALEGRTGGNVAQFRREA